MVLISTHSKYKGVKLVCLSKETLYHCTTDASYRKQWLNEIFKSNETRDYPFETFQTHLLTLDYYLLIHKTKLNDCSVGHINFARYFNKNYDQIISWLYPCSTKRSDHSKYRQIAPTLNMPRKHSCLEKWPDQCLFDSYSRMIPCYHLPWLYLNLLLHVLVWKYSS